MTSARVISSRRRSPPLREYALLRRRCSDGQLVQHPIESLLALGPAEVAGLQDGQNIFLDRHSAKDGGLLRQVSDPGAGPTVHRRPSQVEAVQQDPAVVRTNEPCNKVERRGLSRPVGTQQSHNLTLLDPYRHLVDDPAALEALEQIDALQHARRGRLGDDRLGALGGPARRLEQRVVDDLPRFRGLSPPRHPGLDRIPVVAGLVENPPFGGEPRQHRSGEVIAHLVAGDLDLDRPVQVRWQAMWASR